MSVRQTSAEAGRREATPVSVPAALWRFHFYVGVLIAPLLILTSLSGILYVFAPQIEDVLYARQLHPAPLPDVAPLGLDDLARRFAEDNPGARAQSITPSFSPRDSAAIVFTRDADRESGGAGMGEHSGHGMGGGGAREGRGTRERAPTFTAYLHPQTGASLGVLADETRFRPWMKRFHKNYLAGENGRILTELAASWLMVLLLTGFVLWFPRQSGRIAGVWVPRLKGASRLKWRDFHSILGAYLLLGTLALCFTGLTWSRFSGNYRRSFQKAIGQEAAFRIPAPPSVRPASLLDGVPPPAVDLATVAARAEASGATRPYRISFPKGPDGSYAAQTFDDPPFVDSLTVFVDRYRGVVLGAKGRGSTPPVARFFSMGVALHEGRLFGPANQWLCALTAGMVIFSTVSGLVMWRKRSPRGGFNSPKPVPGNRLPGQLIVALCVLGAFLPTAAISFVALLLLDRLVLSRLASGIRPSRPTAGK